MLDVMACQELPAVFLVVDSLVAMPPGCCGMSQIDVGCCCCCCWDMGAGAKKGSAGANGSLVADRKSGAAMPREPLLLKSGLKGSKLAAMVEEF